MKKILFIFFLILFTIFVFSFGFYFGRDYQKAYQPPTEVNLNLFWQAWNVINERFSDRNLINVEKMIQGAISGMVESLGDPNTRFFTPKETEEFIEGMQGTFGGIGIQIDIRRNQLQVISPIKNTPADRVGLRAGDKIIEIDGVSTVDMAVEEAVTRIRGVEGTNVTLTIFRQEWTENRMIKIQREIIKVPSLDWELINGNIAHLKLHHFIGRMDIDFRNVANEILASPAEKIILDLRNNSGGYFETAKEIAGWFLERGEVIVIKDFSYNQEQEVYRSVGPSRFAKYPIVILINQGSASASEILAGALRDNRGIKIIGEKSFGKGSVQELVRLGDGSSLKVTIANWLTPNQQLITNKGLEPDIIIEKTDDDIDQDKDPQLDKAIEIIKKIR